MIHLTRSTLTRLVWCPLAHEMGVHANGYVQDTETNWGSKLFYKYPSLLQVPIHHSFDCVFNIRIRGTETLHISGAVP